MIPKIIHYCWFGSNPMPPLTEKCIKSWQKYCPDYKIVQWNENNFDISACPLYVQQAYSAQKWAFVTDYVRLKIVFDYGGIYMDTDVELKKTLNPLLAYRAYFGFEDDGHINTGLGFGAEKHIEILKELMADYQDIPFILPDGTADRTPCPERNTQVFLKHGLRQDGSKQILDNSILILPAIYLCPIDCESGLRRYSRKTISVHWYGASWLTEEENARKKKRIAIIRRWMIKDAILHAPNRIMRKLLGEDQYEKLKRIIKR